MSVLVMVTVRDRAADVFGRPFFVPTQAMAIRAFGDEVNNRESVMYRNPEDFDLYEIGSFDDSDASVVWLKPKMISIGKDVRAAYIARQAAIAPKEA